MDTHTTSAGETASHGLLHSPRVQSALVLVFILLAAFLFAETIKSLKEYRYVGGAISQTNAITVTGEGEIFVRPDTAEFTFSIIERGEDVVAVRDTADEKADKAVDALKENGISEDDIKVIAYELHPMYEWQPVTCVRYPCDRKQIQTGFELNMTVRVKVTDLDKAGDMLALVTDQGVSSVSGLTFTLADEDAVLAEARKLAIDEAREKADTLAGDLGVSLVRIVGFSEGVGYQPAPYLARTMSADEFGMGGAIEEKASVTLPVGENRILSNVNITYEIR